jgi:hypothetical protein
VLNEDLRGDQYTGFYPNKLEEGGGGKGIRRDSRLLLTKRFFLVDVQRRAKGPVENGENAAQDGQSDQQKQRGMVLIRVARRIGLHIHLQANLA